MPFCEYKPDGKTSLPRFVTAALLVTCLSACSKPTSGPAQADATSLRPTIDPSAAAPPPPPPPKHRTKREREGVKGLTLFVVDAVQVTGSAAKDDHGTGGLVASALQRDLMAAGFKVVVDEQEPHHLKVKLGVDIELGRANDFATMTVVDDGRLLVALEVEQPNSSTRKFATDVAKKLVDELQKSTALSDFAKGPKGSSEP